MKTKTLKIILSFLIRNRHNKDICMDFLSVLRDMGLSIDDSISLVDNSKISLWYTFSEYLFFDPLLYPDDYPIPEIDEEEIVEFQEWVNSLD